MITSRSPLRLALQKSGRLSEASLNLIQECGIVFDRSDGRLCTVASNFPLELLFLRDDDIAECVTDGVADLGIVGSNVVQELGKPVTTVEALGFARCRLALAVPKASAYQRAEDLDGTFIATCYPNLLRAYLASTNIQAQVRLISGSAEIAPSIGLADAICDLVSSGSTLLTNGLRELVKICDFEAVLIKSSTLPQRHPDVAEELKFRINSVRSARCSKYILLNAPNAALPLIFELLPSLKSPTVIPLAQSGWSAVHSVINEDHFWEVVGKLKAAGAEGLLVLPIEKLIQ